MSGPHTKFRYFKRTGLTTSAATPLADPIVKCSIWINELTQIGNMKWIIGSNESR
jgi:hypothetical protein